MNSNLKKRLNTYLSKLKQLKSNKKKISNQLSFFRLISFSVFIGFNLTIYILKLSNYAYLISSIPLILFIYFFNEYERLQTLISRLNSFETLLELELNRIDLNFSNLNSYDIIFKKYAQSESFYRDLGISGKKGLIDYLNTTKTKVGEKLFIHKLLQLESNSLAEIQERQSLIASLSKNKFATLKFLRLLNESLINSSITAILDLNPLRKDWRKNLTSNLFTKYLFKPFVIIVWFVVFLFFILDLPTILMSFFLINTILFFIFKKQSSIILRSFEKFESSLTSLEKISIYLKGLKLSKFEKEIIFDKKEIIIIFKYLKKINKRVSVQNSPLLHYILNMLFLWDLWQIAALRNWNQKYFEQMQKIIDSIEYLDSILPFSNLKFLNPEFEFPKLSTEIKTFSAKQISHPLIHSSKRVFNPIEKMKLGETLIITGSNMSGKTTYLRSIGINTVLALCGSATCTQNFELPLLQIKTSIKNEDSLEDGISFFYSEVRRIGSILNSSKTNEVSLILLDELLKGTNTRERLIASKSILKELSNTNSYVFITTHDLDLAKKNSKTKLSYFQETILENKMNFDYKIKKGIIRSTNALKILELENLGLKFKQK